MNKHDQYKRIFKFIATLIILTLQTTVFWFFWHDYYNKMILMPFFRRGSWLVVAIYAILLIFFSKLYGGHKIGYYKKIDVIFSQIIGIVCVNGITYLQISLLGLRFLNIIPLIIMISIEFINIIVWTIIFDEIFKKLYPPRKMIIIYGDKSPDSLIKKMNSRSDKYQICAAIHSSKGFNKIIEAISNYDSVIIWDIPSEVRNPILKYCFSNAIRTYIMPKISDIIIMKADSINLFDTPLLLSRNFGLSFDQRIVKRIFDILISLILLVITSPIMLITVIAIKINDYGPVLFKQDRLTIDGKVFSMFKFRSMIVDAEDDGIPRLAGEKDERITSVGKFIRSFRIDELPQLINILLGEMSMVGPRPERPEISEEYMQDMPEFENRLKVKAGLTGYAQVYGYYNTTPYDKLKLDITYIESYSFWLDIKLILLTIKILFRKESTQGLIDGKYTAQPDYDNNEIVRALEDKN